MTFANHLRQLREAAGLTQEQLAQRSAINLWTIRGYEQGRREPNWKGMLALASALGVAAEVFAACESATPEEEQPAAPRGRPRKAENLEEAPAEGKKALARTTLPPTDDQLEPPIMPPVLEQEAPPQHRQQTRKSPQSKPHKKTTRRPRES